MFAIYFKGRTRM